MRRRPRTERRQDDVVDEVPVIPGTNAVAVVALMVAHVVAACAVTA